MMGKWVPVLRERSSQEQQEPVQFALRIRHESEALRWQVHDVRLFERNKVR